MFRDPRIKALVHDALDAARQAGAHYADLRLTSTTKRIFDGSSPYQSIELGWSVRALVDGYWGWAARPDLKQDAGSWLGREAVRLAKANAASGLPRTVDLGSIPRVENGDWTTPIQIDPFEMPLQEVTDWFEGLASHIVQLGQLRGVPETRCGYGEMLNVEFRKQDRAFASTEGSFLTQTVCVVRPTLQFGYRNDSQVDLRLAHGLGAAQTGWEYLAAAPMDDLIREAMDRADQEDALRLPVRPFDVGRYDLILPARAMATLMNQTLGYATELDRALGYEANAGGTSYLGPDPQRYLGTQVASPLITVTADRSTPKALATIRWDDEGVAPEAFTLIKDGTLIDYQTTREQAVWLASWYAKHGRPVRSHGCAAAPDALTLPMQHQPNLTLHPGPAALGLDDLVRGITHGMLVEEMNVSMDYQALNGLGYLSGVTEVRNGKRVAWLRGKMGILFHARELWNNVIAMGGPASLQWMDGGVSEKGEPSQTTDYSMAAVPAVIKQQAVVDVRQKI